MRKSERMAVDETTRLRPNEWSSLEVRIVDISEAGFRAECEATILCGSPIRIDLPGLGETEAQVSWRRSGEIGAQFTVPIDLARCTVARVSSESVLARLLIRRADARSAGCFTHEQKLRREILASLPIHRPDR